METKQLADNEIVGYVGLAMLALLWYWSTVRWARRRGIVRPAFFPLRILGLLSIVGIVLGIFGGLGMVRGIGRAGRS